MYEMYIYDKFRILVQKIMKIDIIIYEVMIPQWYDNDTPFAIRDAQNLSESLCVLIWFRFV